MKPKTKTEERPIVQTLKIDAALFVKLKTFSARTRRTHQDILHTALVEYLKENA